MDYALEWRFRPAGDTGRRILPPRYLPIRSEPCSSTRSGSIADVVKSLYLE